MVDGLLSPGAIRDLIRLGRVPGAVRAGRKYFVPRRGVDALVEDFSNGDQGVTQQRLSPASPARS
jgi:hypothetical protein